MASGLDAVVVGLGPSGAAALLAAAREGLRVVGYDVQESYRKPCGDAVTMHPAYNRLVESSGSVVSRVNRYVIMIEGSEAHSVTTGSEGWYIIDKRALVAYLRESAIAEGALIRKMYVRDLRSLGSRYVVDARGPYRHRVKSETILVYRGIARTDGWDDDTALLDFLPSRTGLFWIFPAADGFVNFGAGFRGWPFHETRREAIARLESATGSFEVVEERGAPIAVFAKEEPVGEGVLRVGEAGGFINAAGGEGNRMALLTGLYAGRSLSSPDPVKEYSRRVSGLVAEALLSKLLLRVTMALSPGDASRLLSLLPRSFWEGFLTGRLGLDLLIRSGVEAPELAVHLLKSL